MKIYIDAGHGGKDPGAVAIADRIGYSESRIILPGALMLAGGLRLMDHDIVMSRYKDKYVSLYRRKVRANLSRSDLFVSIHCNAVSSESVTARGLEVLYYPGASNVGRLLAEEMITTVKIKALWMKIHGDGVVARKDLYVLRKTKMPAIIIELGFITDEQDRSSLLDISRLSELMSVIALTIGSRKTIGLLEENGNDE